MRSNIIFLSLVTFFAVSVIGCGGGETTSNVSNVNTANTNSVANIAQPAANTGLETVKKPEVETTNNAPTLAPIVHAYYDALKRKDDAAVRQVLAADFVRSIEADMKEEKKTGLAAYLAETDRIPEKQMEVRNEKIEGNKGIAQVKGGAYAAFVTIAFVNEGGKWKLSNETPALKP
jgi:hypothetical protein